MTNAAVLITFVALLVVGLGSLSKEAVIRKASIGCGGFLWLLTLLMVVAYILSR